MFEDWDEHGNVRITPHEHAAAVYARGASWVAKNGVFAEFGLDGNLSIFKPTKECLWSSKSGDEKMGAYLSIHRRGDIIIYGKAGDEIWAVKTFAKTGAWLSVQTDGNLVLYCSTKDVLWATHTTIALHYNTND